MNRGWLLGCVAIGVCKLAISSVACIPSAPMVSGPPGPRGDDAGSDADTAPCRDACATEGAATCIGDVAQACGRGTDGCLSFTVGACKDNGACAVLPCAPTPPRPASCTGGGEGADLTCAGTNDCCGTGTTLAAGTFDRHVAGARFPASVSRFKLDAFEVTVGRFRKFVEAVAPASGVGWQPAAGIGKHDHVNLGRGLANSGDGAHTVESGWDSSWGGLPAERADWNTHLVCDPTYATWTPSIVHGNESRPVNCVTWAEAYAFCAWDGGFLPSEAEWEYVAGEAGRSTYPWGADAPGADASLAVYDCRFSGSGTCTGLVNLPPVGSVPAGNTKSGHSDLAGSLYEWVLDYHADALPAACTDCANTFPVSNARVLRGGGFVDIVIHILPSFRYYVPPITRSYNIGFRCARTP